MPRLKLAYVSPPAAVDATDAADLSPCDLSGGYAVDLSGILSGRRFDMDAMRRQTPLRWMQFLRAHFDSPRTVSAMFDVDDRTSRNWWNGKHEPRLSAMLALVKTARPEARIMVVNFMLEAA
jgi:hypothetical protein